MVGQAQPTEALVRSAAEGLLQACGHGAAGHAMQALDMLEQATTAHAPAEGVLPGAAATASGAEGTDEKQGQQQAGAETDAEGALQELRLLAVNIADPSGATPLLLAAKLGLHEVVGRLLQLGADPAPSLHASGNTALHLAAMHGHLEVVKALVGGPWEDLTAQNAAEEQLAQYLIKKVQQSWAYS